VEIHDRLIALLTDVDELRSKEAALIRRRSCAHLGQMAQSEGEVVRCNGELDDVRENQLRLRREMDGLRDVLFTREEDEAIIEEAATSQPTVKDKRIAPQNALGTNAQSI
jgi:hypothetical protein